MRPERWLNIAGVATWLVAAVPTVAGIVSGQRTGAIIVVWASAFLVFGAAFVLVQGQHNGWFRARRAQIVLLVVQAVAALATVATGGSTLAAGLLVVVAGQLLWVFSARDAVLWVIAQTVMLTAIIAGLTALVNALALGAAFAGFQVFALATGSLALSERRAREALSAANDELHATRALLAERSRIDERLRISRDLHDTMGHHLTALSLQLDVASRLADGRAADHLQQAHAITRLLLGDVRDVVSRLREGGRVDLTQALRALAAAPGTLQIHLEAPDPFVVTADAQANALLRCVQEIVTNTARHAVARNLWISLEPRPDGIVLHARDDGRGATAIAWGNGLTGMRERFEEHAGRLDVESSRGGGFAVHGFMPTPPVPSPAP